MAYSDNLEDLIEGVKNGTIVPYLGPGTLQGVTNRLNKAKMPATSDELILAMNDGKEMAPRLMYEFPRAAMHLENKKGRSFIEKFLTQLYGDTQWSASKCHQWLYSLAPKYVIDINRDTQMQSLFQGQAHTLVVGVARIAAHPYRFDLYQWQDGQYHEIGLESVNKDLPILFKPLGSPLPKPSFIASDADFVDYITELMGGFAIPAFLKEYRLQKQYLFLGCRFTRDTERMVMSDIIYGADEFSGWAMIAHPNDKERRYCEKKNIHIIEQDWSALMSIAEELNQATA